MCFIVLPLIPAVFITRYITPLPFKSSLSQTVCETAVTYSFSHLGVTGILFDQLNSGSCDGFCSCWLDVFAEGILVHDAYQQRGFSSEEDSAMRGLRRPMTAISPC
ncbi:hypothetical protein T01_11766 [Trichinella spiralis]|uniref:Uncharacterized protein n=1 Tax=Trichinella spiralis TaxID=6334 RepID=A0A0V1AP43_TRISP|nr:hypothetical protein T01_1433 [Trichinella spiralis]KRY28062.1 hypothetical protein T01_11766 [Trichinella spiralis]